MTKIIGFDATEDHRASGTYADSNNGRYRVWYPLREWGITRAKCREIIVSEDLPIPPKSACFFCPAMRPIEIAALKRNDPESYALAMEMERLFRGGHHFRGDELVTVTAKHKLTGEKEVLQLTGVTDKEARQVFRAKYADTGPTYRYKLSLSRPVRGLARNQTWTELVAEEVS